MWAVAEHSLCKLNHVPTKLTFPAKSFFIIEDYNFIRHLSELVHISEKARMKIL